VLHFVLHEASVVRAIALFMLRTEISFENEIQNCFCSNICSRLVRTYCLEYFSFRFSLKNKNNYVFVNRTSFVFDFSYDMVYNIIHMYTHNSLLGENWHIYINKTLNKSIYVFETINTLFIKVWELWSTTGRMKSRTSVVKLYQN